MLKRLFERAEPDPAQRLFRHAFYGHIAAHKPDLWAKCGSKEQRAKALKDPSSENGSRPAAVIVDAWDKALSTAFNGLKFRHVTGKKKTEREPNGYYTYELKMVSMVS